MQRSRRSVTDLELAQEGQEQQWKGTAGATLSSWQSRSPRTPGGALHFQLTCSRCLPLCPGHPSSRAPAGERRGLSLMSLWIQSPRPNSKPRPLTTMVRPMMQCGPEREMSESWISTSATPPLAVTLPRSPTCLHRNTANSHKGLH